MTVDRTLRRSRTVSVLKQCCGKTIQFQVGTCSDAVLVDRLTREAEIPCAECQRNQPKTPEQIAFERQQFRALWPDD